MNKLCLKTIKIISLLIIMKLFAKYGTATKYLYFVYVFLGYYRTRWYRCEPD